MQHAPAAATNCHTRSWSPHSVDLARADALHGIHYQVADHTEEALHVRELRVRVEGGFVFPTGMNEEGAGSGFFLIKMDVEASGLGASRFQDGQQLVA